MVGLAAFLAADRTGFRGELEPDFCTACSARPHPGVSADSNRPMRCPCCPTAALRHVSIGALFFGAKTSVFRRRVPAPAAQGRPVGPEAARGVPPGARQVAARRPLQQGAPPPPTPALPRPVRARFAGRPGGAAPVRQIRPARMAAAAAASPPAFSRLGPRVFLGLPIAAV